MRRGFLIYALFLLPALALAAPCREAPGADRDCDAGR